MLGGDTEDGERNFTGHTGTLNAGAGMHGNTEGRGQTGTIVT